MSTGAHPLSWHQQGIWLHQQQAPRSVVYNTGMALQILSEVDLPGLRRTLQIIVNRHYMLRAAFGWDEGQPVQRVLEDLQVALPRVDATGWDEERLRAEVAQTHRTPYDLVNGPLFRACLFTQAPERHVLLMGAHHLVMDAASWLQVLDEIRQGVKADAAVPEMGYFDYAARETGIVRDREDELRAYWRSRLAGVPVQLELPMDHLRPLERRYEGGSEFFSLAPELNKALNALAKREKVTLTAVLLATFQVLLHRYSQLDRFVVGVPTSNRPSGGGAATVGNFINVLPIDADLRAHLTIVEQIRQVWRTLLTGLRNRAYPFLSIVQDLNIPHNPAISPLAQVLFSFPQSTPELAAFLLAIPGKEDSVQPVCWGGLSVKPYGLRQQDGGFDLGLEMVQTPTGCVGVFKYNSDLFRPDTIRRMTGHFLALLEAAAARPEDCVGDLAIVTGPERQQILVEWNRTKGEYPQNRRVHRLFEEQVERTPGAVAVVQHNLQVTYDELNRRANQLAHYLVAQGVGPEAPIGICLARSIETIVAVLGVLKAGGAYVPLDPSYPQARLQAMLDQANVSLLLTQSVLDDAASVLPNQPWTNPNTLVEAGNLAYCIFTSGSTGKPKGVLVEHGGLTNLADAQIEEFGLHSESRVLQFASFSFDAFASELFTTLLSGGQLCLPRADALPVGDVLYQELRTHGITAITLPPSVLGTLPPYKFETLVVAGEACPPALARQWAPRCDRLINAYGPTEATVCAAMIRLGPGDLSGKCLPIGRPIAHARLYILDSTFQPAPVGVPGELYIGGPGVARGYLNQPQSTMEKFIADPFRPEAESGRIYKTGDQCRYLPDGRIEFLGRIDSQVKMRGFRIELAEIENELLMQAGVSGAVAILREDQPGDKRIVAYFVGAANGEALRLSLAERLPDYMAPAAFVSLEQIPLTPNGKLDRLALPTPNYAKAKADFAAPRNEVEALLARAFAETLRIPDVGIHDNFFRLGGDSILSIGVTSRAGRQGYAVSVDDLFRFPTVAQLAATIHAKHTPRDYASQELQFGDAPLLPIQRWFLERNEAAILHFNQYFLLTVKTRIEPVQLETAARALLSHHDALRFQYSKNEDGWGQEYLPPVDREVVEFFDVTGRTEIDEISGHVQTSLNPLYGDLVRFVYFRASETDYLLMVIHHLAVDGVSWRILVEDLAALLDGRPLPAKTSSYAGWGNMLQTAARNGSFDAEAGYWLAAAPQSRLPLDGGGTGDRHRLSLNLHAGRTNDLLRTLPDLHHVTLDSVVLAALTETLTDWCGAASMPVAFESHGRQQLLETIAVDRTVGWFTAAYPLNLPRRAGTAVERIRYTLDCMRQVPNGGIGFGALRDFHPDAAVRAEMTTLPAPAVAYNYLGQLDALGNEWFGIIPGAAGLSASPQFRGRALIESNSLIMGGQLHLDWTVSPQIEFLTAQTLFDNFQQGLEALIAQALDSREKVPIPSDYPNADLSIQQLKTVFKNRASIETIFSLSPLQSGMLFHSRMDAGRGTYIEQDLFHVDGQAFDADRFVAAIQTVIDRHDNLRAAFEFLRGGEAVQVIQSRAVLPVVRLDWRNLSGEGYRQRVAAVIESERMTDFDLACAPLLRLTLIAREWNAYDLLLTFHHVLLDRWSVNLFWDEARLVYAGRPSDSARPYEAYIGHLRRQVFDRPFWLNYLKGFQAPTPLPGLTRLPKEQGTAGSYTTTLSNADTEQISAFAKDQGVTLNVLFQAAWAILLARYARETDVVFGMVTSGRTAAIPGIESISGLLINTLPFRVQLKDGVTGAELLQDVAKTQMQLQRREHTPLVEVQQASETPPGTALFSNLFLFQNTPKSDLLKEDALVLDRGWVEPGHSGYPLMALVAPGEIVRLTLGYDRERYDAATVEQLVGHWKQIVMGMIEQPQRPVLALPMLTAGERERIVFDWSSPAKGLLAEPWPAGTIHGMFERRVEGAPDSVALSFEGEQISYGELNARANRLAHRLIECGVRPETPVAVVMERSPDVVVSLLAVLKAGGAYVPVDPAYPAERIAFTLRDCGAPLVLTEPGLIGRLPQEERQCVFASDGWHGYPAINPRVAAAPDHLAYVIYTSGSTGQPKGAPISHRNVTRLFSATHQWFGFHAGDVWTLFHSFAFDFSVWEMWGALCYGGRLVIVPYQVSRDPRSFYRLLCEQGVTVLNQTPSAFRQLAGVAAELAGGVAGELAAEERRSTALRYVIFGGEALDFESLRPWFALYGDSRPQLVNMYGITETTVHVTYQPIRLEDLDRDRGRSRIGIAIPDLQLYILDDYSAPVPVGVAGELHVGGAGLARGYLNRPELTAERFIEHPELGRLYQTGDLARWLPDGNVEYLGRTDFQVKIRGFRVELGEIEKALTSQEGVREAVALVREDQPGNQRIAAYLTGTADTGELRERLRERLPEYMLPSAFVKLDALPLTANGKLDRAALPPPDHASAQKEFVAPRSRFEEQLGVIWREVLGVKRVGIHDNFFALGGHSLSATRVAAHVRNRFQSDLPIRTIFETKNLAELARAVEVATDYQRVAVMAGANDEEF